MTRSKKPSNTPQDTPDAVKTDKAWVDPMREREAGLYERPIVSRELILSYLGELGQPAPMAQIAADLQVDPEDDE